MSTGSPRVVPGLMVLGDGGMAAAGVSAKAANLDRASQAGLPVPAGVVVIDGADLGGLVDVLAQQLSKPVAVRSAFSAEDRHDSAMAGHFLTELDVNPEPGALHRAIDNVRASGAADFRRDVLVMEMVGARAAGVAFSEPGWSDDLVNAVAGLADGLVGGAEAGDRLHLPRLRRWEGHVKAQAGRFGPLARLARIEEPAWSWRLQLLLRDLRAEFGDEAWDIEWADDGEVCHLVQVRPVTVPSRRDEVFTMANHREILPDPPSTLMTSLIVDHASRFAGPLGMLSGGRDDRLFIEAFDGRPYLNQSLVTDFLVRLGLPTAMVSDALGGADTRGRPLNPARLFVSIPTFARLGFRQVGAVRSARAAAAQMKSSVAQREAATFEEAIGRAGITYVSLVDQMASLATAMAVPVSVLRRIGVLAEHLRTQRSAGTRMADDLAPLAARAATLPGAAELLRSGQLPDDPELVRLWEAWLTRHGHRGRFESDLASPRFAEEPETVLMTVPSAAISDLALSDDASAQGVGPAPASGPAGASSLLVSASRPLWWIASGPMQAREQLRSDAMAAFAHHRRELLRLAGAAVGDGRLPAVDDLWLLTTEDLRGLDRGEILTAADIELRREQRQAVEAIEVPDLRSRFGPISHGESGSSREYGQVEPGLFRGLSLSPGRVQGRAWVLRTPSVTPPADFDPEATVLVARSIDAGWIPTFSLARGVAVEIGGDLSHGSIILRELGTPAITNVAGLTAEVETGAMVELDAAAGTLRVISESASSA